MGSKKQPDPPDYAAAAREQGQANKEAAIASAMLSNPNIYGPYGSQEVSYSRGPDGNLVPTINQAFSEDEQAKYDANNAITMSLYGTAQEGLGRVDDMMNQDFDTSGFTDYQTVSTPNQGRLPGFWSGRGAPLPDVERLSNEGLTEFGDASVGGLSAVSDAIRNLNADRLAQEESELRSDLAARGFDPGSEGFDRQIRNFNQRLNDFDLQALLAAGQEQSRIAGDLRAQRGQEFGERSGIWQSQTADRNRDFAERMQREQQFLNRRRQVQSEQRDAFNMENLAAQTNANTRNRQLQEAQFLRQLPLSEINALRTGGQPMMPQFQQYQGAQVQAAPLMDAAMAQGNYDLASYQAQPDLMGGLFGLGGALLGAGGAAGGFGKLFG